MRTKLVALVALALVALAIPGNATADTTSVATANTVTQENQQAGTAAWQIPSPNQAAIAGYADSLSYLPGQTVSMYVDSHGDPFTYQVFRMGYYQGLGGRLMLDQSTPTTAIAEPAYSVSPFGSYLSSDWMVTARFVVPPDWMSGFYLVKLHDEVNGDESYVTFTLVSPDPSPIVVEFQTDTWTAYNGWGGYSAYYSAQRLSMNRPWAEEGGAGKFFLYDLSLVEYLESRGYPVSYATNQELAAGTITGPNTRLLIESGHPEYHTNAEREHIVALPNQGVSVAIFGGNSWTQQVRIDPASRIFELWRYAARDPVKGPLAAIRWEDLQWPQNQFTGEMQTWAKPVGNEFALGATHWAWNGAGVTDKTSLGAIEGWEWDGVSTNKVTPRNLTILSRTPMAHYRGLPSYSEMTIRDFRNGAFVFNAGQLGFNWLLDTPQLYNQALVNARYPTTDQVSPRIQRLVGNLIHRATGIPNPEPSLAQPKRITHPNVLVAPGGVIPAHTSLIMSWTSPPAATTKVRIYIDGTLAAVMPPTRQTWTGAGVDKGLHSLRVVAVARDGRILAASHRTVTAYPITDSRFWHDYVGEFRAYIVPPPAPHDYADATAN
jgi:hypothetical protein